jgi:hypothetical protein
VSSSAVPALLVLVALDVSAPCAVADPPARAKPPPLPGSMSTPWPAALSTAHQCRASLWSPSEHDVFRWSSARGAAMTFDPSHAGDRPLPPAFLRDPPRTLTWIRHGRPGMTSSGDIIGPQPKPPHALGLSVGCSDIQAEWQCDDRQPSCRPSLRIPAGDPEVTRRHHVDRDRIMQTMLKAKGARDIFIADALRLIEDACANGRCSVVVARTAERMRAAVQEPPWTLVPPRDDKHLGLRAQGRPGDRIICGSEDNRGFEWECELTLGDSVHFKVEGDQNPYQPHFEELRSDTWALAAPGSGGFVVEGEAVR